MKPILLWLYFKNRKVILKKFQIKFQLGKYLYNLAENFIRIYLEHKDKDYFIISEVLLYPSCCINRYLWEITDNSYRYDDGEGDFGSKFHYP